MFIKFQKKPKRCHYDIIDSCCFPRFKTELSKTEVCPKPLRGINKFKKRINFKTEGLVNILSKTSDNVNVF